MQLDFAILAQNADATEAGKLHIFGAAFDTLTVPSVPATVAPFMLVLRFAGEPGDIAGTHWVGLSITNPQDETSVIDERKEFRFEPKPVNSELPSSALVLVTVVVTFQSAGRYSVNISLDGRSVKTLPIHVVVTSQGAERSEV